jgi:hypothetical protein
MAQSIDIILNIIASTVCSPKVASAFICSRIVLFLTVVVTIVSLDVGIIGGCADLCSFFPNQVEQAVCNLLCDAVGIEGFITLIEEYAFKLLFKFAFGLKQIH